MHTVLVVRNCINEVEAAARTIQKQFSSSDIAVLTTDDSKHCIPKNGGIKSIISINYTSLNQLSEKRKEIKKGNFSQAVIPYTEHETTIYAGISFFGNNLLLILGLYLYLCGIKKIYFFGERKLSYFSAMRLFFNLFSNYFSLAIAPLIIVARTPFFLISEFLGKFLLARSDKKDPLLGFSLWKNMTGSIYYPARVEMSKKFGIFGMNHEDYMGTPVTLHRSPLDIAFLRFLGYKRYVILSIGLCIISFVWIIGNGNALLYIAIPFIFLSTYFIRSIIIGHIEFFAWGFFLLSIVSMIHGHAWLAAIFLALAVLTNISIALIGGSCILTIFIYDIVYEKIPSIAALHDFLIFCIIMAVCTAFFLIPMIRSWKKLSRNDLLNTMWGWKPGFGLHGTYQFLIYGIFLLAIFILVPFTILHIMTLIPLIILYYNSKIKWIFSDYTIDLSILFIGSLFILYSPNPICIAIFFYLVYTSPLILLGGYYGVSKYSFSFRPFRLGPLRNEIVALFSSIPDGSRVALESGNRITSYYLFEYSALLSYLLARKDIELLNAFSPEFVEKEIYYTIIQHLTPVAASEELETVLRKGGATHIITFTNDFKSRLDDLHYTNLGSVDCQELVIDETRPGPVLTLFAVPFKSDIIEPPSKIITKPNVITFECKANITYTLKYNYYHGWRAFQDNRRIRISDARPGMIVTSEKDGFIELRYNYLYYLT